MITLSSLSFPNDSPPLSVIVAAKIAGISLEIDSTLPSASSPTSNFSNGLKLHGVNVLQWHISRATTDPNLYGHDIWESGQIDEWLEYAHIFSVGSEFENACSFVDGYMSTRSFLVGHSFSIADLSIWSGLAALGVASSVYHSSRELWKYPRWADYKMIATTLMVVAQRVQCQQEPRMTRYVQKILSLLGGFLYVFVDLFPTTPHFHVALQLAAAAGVGTCNV